jgi:CelD/BcsL family acetyltransferase involved in cellulose biosynthesis
MPERHFSDLGLTLEVVTSLERLETLRADYDRLHRVANVGLPFELHDWHVAWWRAFAASSIKLRDQLLFHVVRSATEGCVAIVPLVLTERPGFGPLRIGTLALLGTDQYITELRKPTIAPGFEAKVGEVVQRSLASDGRWDWAHWTGAEPEFARALAGLGTQDQLDPNPDYVLDLAPSWDAFKAGLKRNIRESIRHCYNSLKRENHTHELVVAKTPAEIRSGLDRFIELHSARADLDDTVAHPDRFATPMTRGFLYDVCLRLAARDIARVFLLKISGEIVAARIGFEMNDTLYMYYSGYDPKWRKYSVMTTLVAEAIKYAIERGVKTVNLSAGTDVSKTRWGAREVPFAETLQLRARARSKLASKAYQTAKTANTNHPLVKVLLRALPKRQWGGTQG